MVSGVVRPPGDKSISHRVLMLAAVARGRSELTGLLTGDDVRSSARVLRQLGADISRIQESRVSVAGSRLRAPSSRLNCGNSGTTARLMCGILAGQRFASTLTGDASLRRRPMRRVTEPLKQMGADIKERGDGLPLTIRGGTLRGLTYTSPVASAQVKSALLFAGLTGQVPVTIREPYRSRDHTERLFAHLGLGIHERDGAIVFEPSHRSNIPAFQLSVPGDPSSAAFLVAAAVLADKGELIIENVGVNPTRTGFVVVLERMGAHVERVNLRDAGGEPVADLVVRPANLRGTEVTAAEIPTLVDEVPILAVLASRAGGTTMFREVGELRVKESNRLELIAANLRAVGVKAEVHGNDLHIEGTETAPRGKVDTAKDHRLAMAFAVLGTVDGAKVTLSERKSVAISYPNFFRSAAHARTTHDARRTMTVRVIAIDGPAASGKSSTAGQVAERLGWAHLDSGALYRALTLAALDNLGEGGRRKGEEWPAQQVVDLAGRLPVRLVLAGNSFRPEVAGADVEQAIRGERVTRFVSVVAAMPEVRTWVNTQQRRAVGGMEVGGGVVVDGRDIGTIVFPEAPLKVFLTATPHERARRRLFQRGQAVDVELVRRESQALEARDAADSNRRVAPLKPAQDAVLLDTTALTLEEQVTRVVELARARFPG